MIETWHAALLECFTRMHLAPDWSIRMQDFIFILKVTVSLLWIIFGQSLHLFLKMFKNENKGIVFKLRLVCTAWYKHGREHYLSGKNNGHAHVIRPYKPGALYSFLNTHKNKWKRWPKMIHNEVVTFNMKIKPCIIMDQSGARCMRVKHSTSAARRVSIVWYQSGKNQSDCTNSLKCKSVYVAHK